MFHKSSAFLDYLPNDYSPCSRFKIFVPLLFCKYRRGGGGEFNRYICYNIVSVCAYFSLLLNKEFLTVSSSLNNLLRFQTLCFVCIEGNGLFLDLDHKES